mmetsp:Transcript_12897/g.32689  ORF Transcript_12897/g.32689 Transcript_12897/m.32689 type:complete len:225 (+) Transcript_12897:63-737(+)
MYDYRYHAYPAQVLSEQGVARRAEVQDHGERGQGSRRVQQRVGHARDHRAQCGLGGDRGQRKEEPDGRELARGLILAEGTDLHVIPLAALRHPLAECRDGDLPRDHRDRARHERQRGVGGREEHEARANEQLVCDRVEECAEPRHDTEPACDQPVEQVSERRDAKQRRAPLRAVRERREPEHAHHGDEKDARERQRVRDVPYEGWHRPRPLRHGGRTARAAGGP